METTYTKNIKEKEIDKIEEETWRIFNQCDEISAKGYLKDNTYIIEAYYEDKIHYDVCTQKLEKLGFKESKKPKNHYGDGTCYYNGVFECIGCGECND